jgi:hypothetical protein
LSTIGPCLKIFEKRRAAFRERTKLPASTMFPWQKSSHLKQNPAQIYGMF